MKLNKLYYHTRLFLSFASGLLLLILTGCSTFSSSDSNVNYKKSVTTQPLEIPPEFTATSINEQLVVPDLPTQTTTIGVDNNQRSGGQAVAGVEVLPRSQQVQVMREGNMRWLIVQAPPSLVWVKVKKFLQEQGFAIEVQEPKVGVIETQWAEQQLNVPERGLRKFFGKVLNTIYSADVRDKYRIRLAYGSQENTTEVYLTHQGAKEVAVGEDFRWQARPSEPALEMEMLNRLMVFLGLEKETAETLLAQTEVTSPTQSTQPVEAQEATSPGSPLAVITRTQDGQISLLLQEEIEKAWRRIGFALDRAKFTLADRDRQERIYYIRYIDPDTQSKSGFLSYIFGGDSDEDKAPEYRIKLIPELDSTRIVILTNQNEPAPSATAEKILTVLEEQIK